MSNYLPVIRLSEIHVKPHSGLWQRCQAVFMLLPLAACASLPNAKATAVPQTIPVTFETAQGPVSPAKSEAILRKLDSESGSSDLLQKHLKHEEAINNGSPLVLGNRLALLEDGPATYRAMFAAIRAARNHINFETYIFEDGEVGKEFSDLLIQKQAEGVQVNLVYDSVGCLNTPAEFFERMSQAGINVLEYNPVNPAKGLDKSLRINNRDHRKLLIVDGKTVFLGGINISESYSSGSSGKLFRRKGASAKAKGQEAGWRDTHIQIDGPAVAEFQKLFIETWERQQGKPLANRDYFPLLEPQGKVIVRAIASTPDTPDSPIYLTLLSAIDHAEKAIHLTNAYFVPDEALIKALTRAARRGVDVRFVLPGKTDSWLTFHAGRSHYQTLLDGGVRIYERHDTILHSKTAVIDGVWSTIGSTNLDWRSFLHNDEANAVMLGEDIGGQLDAMFGRDLAASVEIDSRQWQRRSPWLRLQEWTARLFEYWL